MDIEQLRQLKQLFDEGVITEEEFAHVKANILGTRMNASASVAASIANQDTNDVGVPAPSEPQAMQAPSSAPQFADYQAVRASAAPAGEMPYGAHETSPSDAWQRRAQQSASQQPDNGSLRAYFLQKAQSQDPTERIYAAINKDLPQDLFGTLADDPDASVRRAVARNESTPPELLKHLASDGEAQVRQAVAANASTPVDALQTLGFGDSRDDVRWAAAANLRQRNQGTGAAIQPGQTQQLPTAAVSAPVAASPSATGGTTPFLAQWKTSVGASIAGMLVSYAVFGALSMLVNTQTTYSGLVTMLWMATFVEIGLAVACFLIPPKRFTQDYQGTNTGVSFVNCFIGGIFGCLWNANLTNRKSNQVSHWIIGVLFLVVSLIYGINAIALMSSM